MIAGNFSGYASRVTHLPEPRPASRRAARDPGAAARAEILHGLAQPQKTTPSKYLYDARGSELFEQICELPEYYLSRAEMAAMRRHLPEIARALGRGNMLIEPGAGGAQKPRVLLGVPGLAVAYVAIEICRKSLAAAVSSLRSAFPDMEITGVCADFTQPVELPLMQQRRARRVVFFPGSTIGNCTPEEATALLARFRRLVGPDGGILVGVDLYKSRDLLLPAYDDAAGVTALFNENLLHRLNADFAADFKPARFAHRAVWNEDHHRIEMHLVSRVSQRVNVGPHCFDFAAGESLVTEYSYKLTREEFAAVAGKAGLCVQEFWTDRGGLFSVQYLRPTN